MFCPTVRLSHCQWYGQNNNTHTMDMYRANDGCTYLRCGIIATIFVPTSNLRDLTVEDYINNTFFVKICLSHGYMSHGLYKGMDKFLLIKIISGNYCVYKKQFRMCGTAFCILCVWIYQASIFAYVAFFSMNSRRGPTSSPMSMENM